MPWGKVTFNEHLQKLASVGSWGTQVELQAVSDCSNVTVFVCSPNISQIIRWEIKGTPKHHSTIRVPPMSLHTTLPFTHGAHIELCYCLQSSFQGAATVLSSTNSLPSLHSDTPYMNITRAQCAMHNYVIRMGLGEKTVSHLYVVRLCTQRP